MVSPLLLVDLAILVLVLFVAVGLSCVEETLGAICGGCELPECTMTWIYVFREQSEARDVQILPNDQSFHCAQFKTLEGIFNTEAVLASVLADLVKVLLDQPLLLHKLDISKRLCCKFNRLAR